MKQKKEIVIPPFATCKNCETPMQGRYCYCCGQDIVAGSQKSARGMLFNTFENILALDNKTFSTLKYLIIRPGKLSHEYKNGRIVNYVYPSKLFWFIIIIFFILLSLHLKNGIKEQLINDKQQKTAVSVEDGKTTPETITSVDVKKTIAHRKSNTNHLISGDIDFNRKFISSVSVYAPYVILLLVPFFSLLLSWFFHKQGYFYADHLAFALHFHSFAFLLFGIYLGIKCIFTRVSFPIIVYMLIPAVYLVVALYVFYRPKKWSLIWKTISLNFIYFLVVGIIAVLLTILLVASINPGILD